MYPTFLASFDKPRYGQLIDEGPPQDWDSGRDRDDRRCLDDDRVRDRHWQRLKQQGRGNAEWSEAPRLVREFSGNLLVIDTEKFISQVTEQVLEEQDRRASPRNDGFANLTHHGGDDPAALARCRSRLFWDAYLCKRVQETAISLQGSHQFRRASSKRKFLSYPSRG